MKLFCRKKDNLRLGGAAVEFALVAPILISCVLGMAEFGRALMVRQVLNDAVRKACRTGVLPNRSTANITQEINDILTDNGLPTDIVTITVQVNGVTADALTAKQNDQVSVQVSLSYSQVAWVPAFFLGTNTTIYGSLVMCRQG